MNHHDSHCPAALRRRRRGAEAAPSGEAASWLHWKGKVGETQAVSTVTQTVMMQLEIMMVACLPAAARRGPASGRPRPGPRETIIVTSWSESQALS
jgi:hypothetical protein